jgi:hypothetical protein
LNKFQKKIFCLLYIGTVIATLFTLFLIRSFPNNTFSIDLPLNTLEILEPFGVELKYTFRRSKVELSITVVPITFLVYL